MTDPARCRKVIDRLVTQILLCFFAQWLVRRSRVTISRVEFNFQKYCPKVGQLGVQSAPNNCYKLFRRFSAHTNKQCKSTSFPPMFHAPSSSISGRNKFLWIHSCILLLFTREQMALFAYNQSPQHFVVIFAEGCVGNYFQSIFLLATNYPPDKSGLQCPVIGAGLLMGFVPVHLHSKVYRVMFIRLIIGSVCSYFTRTP